MRAYPSKEKLKEMRELAWIAIQRVDLAFSGFVPLADHGTGRYWRPEENTLESDALKKRFKVDFNSLVNIGDGQLTYRAAASAFNVNFSVDGVLSGDKAEVERLAVLELAAAIGRYVTKTQYDDSVTITRVKQPVGFDFGSYKQLTTLTPTWRLMAKNKTEFAKCGQVDDLRDLTIKALKTKLTERESELASVKAENERLSSALKKIIVLCESEVWQTKR